MSQVEPYSRKVYYYETDKMSIVHHSNYIRMFEEARLDFMDKCGINYAQIESLEIIMPVLEVSCKYVKSLFYGETFSVVAEVTSFNGIKMGFKYKIYAVERNELVTTGESWHCFLDNETRTPVSLKKRAPKVFEEMTRIIKETL